jgi:hypothetical protein
LFKHRIHIGEILWLMLDRDAHHVGIHLRSGIIIENYFN